MNVNIVPNLKTDNKPPNNKGPKVYFYFAVCLSILGVVAFLLTKDIAVVTAMNLPLVTLITQMKWKK